MNLRTKNKAFDTAYQDGYRARMMGKPRADNPYTAVKWGATFHKYWDMGWRAANSLFTVLLL